VSGATEAATKGVATLYNAAMTAFVLGLVSRRGAATAADYVFRHFRRQHLEKFKPGLDKLGIAGERHAPACALYHYHSNALGGVKTGYLRESDTKAWVRYPPPRWIWKGTAIAAIPHEVNVAMLHGWHGHNGVSLGNPRLGFVCTGTTVEGDPGLEGYYIEEARPLAEAERVRFSRAERMPPIDWRTQPALPGRDWPELRRLRTLRAYAAEYLRTLLVVAEELLGSTAAQTEIGRACRLVGLQHHEETARTLDLPTDLERGDRESALLFARWLAAMLEGAGEAAEIADRGGTIEVRLDGWKLGVGLSLADRRASFSAWSELWIGAAAAHDRFLTVATRQTYDGGRPSVAWNIVPR